MGPADGLGEGLGLMEADGDTDADVDELGERDPDTELLGDILADG